MFLFPFGLTECLIGALLFFQPWHWSRMMQLQYMALMITQNLMILWCYPSNDRRKSFLRFWSCLVTATEA